MDDAVLYAQIISNINAKMAKEGTCFGQQYLLEKGLKVFGQEGRDACVKEVDQLNNRNAFEPILIGDMSKSKRKKAQRAPDVSHRETRWHYQKKNGVQW